MTDTFIRLTDDEGDHFYVNTAHITLIAPTGEPDLPTAVRSGDKLCLCAEPVAAVIDALNPEVIEVAAA